MTLNDAIDQQTDLSDKIRKLEGMTSNPEKREVLKNAKELKNIRSEILLRFYPGEVFGTTRDGSSSSVATIPETTESDNGKLTREVEIQKYQAKKCIYGRP